MKDPHYLVPGSAGHYPFGMVMPGRRYSAGNQYRYGFNGKESDNEISGQGNQYDYGFRIYNPRLGQFLSVDPLTSEYPWNSPYSYAEGDPINFIDLDGLETPVARSQTRTGNSFSQITNTQGGSLFKKTGAGVYRLGTLPSSSGKLAAEATHRFMTNEEIEKLRPPNGNLYINADGITATAENGSGHWQVSLLKEIHKVKTWDEMTWYERGLVRLTAEQDKLFNTYKKWNSNVQAYEYITNDASTLPQEYLAEVQDRLIQGKATAQDLIYQKELRNRKILYEINDKHNPAKPLGGANASVLPENHYELWANRSYYDENNDAWWSVEGSGKKAVYHRFSGDGNGAYHWSGSTGTNKNRGGGSVKPIPKAPIKEIKEAIKQKG